MRTGIVIDDDLIRRAQEIAGTGTRRETVDLALRELVDLQQRRSIPDLRGKVRWEGGPKASRRGRDRS